MAAQSFPSRKLNLVKLKTLTHKKLIPFKVSQYNIINIGINESKFDDGLKYADITPVHKKGDFTDKSNYRPVSVLPIVSNVFERTMQNKSEIIWISI